MSFQNGWSEYEKLVLDKLDGHGEDIKALAKEVAEMRTELAVLKVKASAWGAAAGMIPAAAALLWQLVIGRKP